MFMLQGRDGLPALYGKVLLGCNVNDRCRFTLDGRFDDAETARGCSSHCFTMLFAQRVVPWLPQEVRQPRRGCISIAVPINNTKFHEYFCEMKRTEEMC